MSEKAYIVGGAALQKVPSGPVTSRHGDVTAYEHTMEAVDRAKVNDCSFGVFLEVLCHDFGKAVTPEELLPHHYGHEEKSEEIAAKWLRENRFRKNDGELVLAFARHHMKVHALEEMRPSKLVRFVRVISKKHREEIFRASNCDSPLSARQWQIVRALERVLSEGIDSKRLAQLKKKSAIPLEVQRQYVENYRRLIAEMEW